MEGKLCRKCKANTYSDENSTYCKKCSKTEKSPVSVGATTCIPLPGTQHIHTHKQAQCKDVNTKHVHFFIAQFAIFRVFQEANGS